MSMAALTRRTLSLSLALTPGVGGKTVTRVLTRNDLLGRTTDEFLRVGQEALREEYRFTAKAAAAWTTNTDARIDRAKAVEDRLSAHGVQLVTAADAHYPRRIEQMDSDPPGVLFLFGNARLLEADTFSVLSSRDTSARGLEAIEKLTEEGVLAGKTLVSGHDTPEYQRSAIVPLRWGAPRVLVLDRGLFRALGEELKEEPFRAARLWRFQFDDKTDLAVSCLNPDSDYHPNSNKIRDRLIASLSSTIDMVEIRAGGNMEALAKSALRAGRPVRICDWAGAAKNLAKIGAKPMTV
jgi:DNA processing protein